VNCSWTTSCDVILHRLLYCKACLIYESKMNCSHGKVNTAYVGT
jgi:hypothetical protein